MATYNVTMIPGDGIGPEVAEATQRVLEATGLGFSWEHRDIGLTEQGKQSTNMPAGTVESRKRDRDGLKGPNTTAIGEGFRSVNVGLRQEIGL